MSTKRTEEIDLSEKIKECVSFLGILADDPQMRVNLKEEEKIALMKIAGRISHPERAELRQRNYVRAKNRRQNVVKKERKARAATGIRSARAMCAIPNIISFISSMIRCVKNVRNLIIRNVFKRQICQARLL